MHDHGRLPPPEDLRAAIDRAQSLGVMLYHCDLASAIGTDVMLAKVRAPRERGIAGCLTLREGDERGAANAWLVQFFSAEDPPNLLCRVRVPAPGAAPRFEAIDRPVPVSDDLRWLIRARRTALEAIGPVAQPQNPVILPGQAIGKDGIVVYLLAGTTRHNVVVLGKHHRVLVSPDGEVVVSVEPLSSSVLEVSLDPPPEAVPGGGRGVFVTHLVTEHPLETHVFASLLHGMPVVVGTSRGSWVVDGDEISLLEAPLAQEPPPPPPPTQPRTPPPSQSARDAPADAPSIPPPPPFSATLSRKPWWQFW